MKTLMILAALACAICAGQCAPRTAASCNTTCYGSGSYQTCNTYCY